MKQDICYLLFVGLSESLRFFQNRELTNTGKMKGRVDLSYCQSFKLVGVKNNGSIGSSTLTSQRKRAKDAPV